MLNCSACRFRCLQTLIGDAVQSTSINPIFATSSTRRFSRSFTAPADSSVKTWKNIAPRPKDQDPDGAFIKPRPKRDEWLKSRGVRPPTKQKKPDFDSPGSMNTHLKYLQDPIKLADFVRYTLQNDDFETAEKVVRAASKSVQCVVSWNHLVHWQLSKGRMNAAIKTYNEMKKRAQTPDAYTYTIIFNGCSQHKQVDQALEKVLAIYQSMLSDRSPVQPNTIHMNAMLKMCAKAQNMDALFSIADHMPTHGLRAPNTVSYTTILNALRQHAVSAMGFDLTPMQTRANKLKAILQGRFIWKEITKRWRRGDIWIDEQLVCAMGRLLVIGGKHDQSDVFALIEQAMNISRPVPSPIESDTREVTEPSNQERPQSEQLTIDNGKETTPLPTDMWRSDPEDSSMEAQFKDQFEVIAPPKPPKGFSAYAQPGRNTLSLVMLAALELRDKKLASRYWNVFTEEKGVRPDNDNYDAYFRCLRVARSSSELAAVLVAMPNSDVGVSTFRIAMAACKRDKLNPQSFANAGRILDKMQNCLPTPDVKVIEAYLDLAVSSPASPLEASASHRQVLKSSELQGRQILRALQRIGPSFLNIKSVLNFKHDPTHGMDVFNWNLFVKTVLELTQRMIGAYDLLMHNRMVPMETYPELVGERKKLTAFVTRHKEHKTGVIRQVDLERRSKVSVFDDAIKKDKAVA